VAELVDAGDLKSSVAAGGVRVRFPAPAPVTPSSCALSLFGLGIVALGPAESPELMYGFAIVAGIHRAPVSDATMASLNSGIMFLSIAVVAAVGL
jgi:hypothetical protein